MGLSKPKRPISRAAFVPAQTKQEQAVSRNFDGLATAVEQVSARIVDRDIQTVDLAVGRNTLTHRLGRTARGFTVTPTALDATFATALVSATDRQITIDVAGAATQKAVTLEVF